eukprot:2669468-Rhodomonas_salina.10
MFGFQRCARCGSEAGAACEVRGSVSHQTPTRLRPGADQPSWGKPPLAALAGPQHLAREAVRRSRLTLLSLLISDQVTYGRSGVVEALRSVRARGEGGAEEEDATAKKGLSDALLAASVLGQESWSRNLFAPGHFSAPAPR